MNARIILTLLAALLLVACQSSPTASEAAKAETPDHSAEDQPMDQQEDPVPAAAEDEPAAAAAEPADGEPSAGTEEAAGDRHPALLDPSLAAETAPDEYKLKFKTTAGDFTVEIKRDWAPNGADRLYNLAKIGYYDDVAFFRLVDGFMAQFGIHGDGDVNKAWREARIPDDNVIQSNKPGYITFATAGPNTRTTQLFINYGDNAGLDRQGFAPLGKVVEGMDVVNKLHKGYGERPRQDLIQSQGNVYLRKSFPDLDYIKTVEIL
ncbi:MAG: peptidylprolyl isomerase [Bradymonadaceae bacterium]